MIKILWRLGENYWGSYKTEAEEGQDVTLEKYIKELVDKDNWTIIAATIEYIILQKRDYTPKALIKGDVVELPSIEGAEELDSPQ